MPDPSVNSSTLNRDLNLGTTHNLFCHDIVSNNVIYTDALSATGMMMCDAIAVAHTSTLNGVSCQTVQVDDTVNVNNSLAANVLMFRRLWTPLMQHHACLIMSQQLH